MDLDGWMEGWKEGWMEGRKDGRKEGRMEGWKEGRMDGWMEGRKEGRMEGWKEGRMEGRMDGWMSYNELIQLQLQIGGLVQLLRRRCRWILSFDVGDDPECRAATEDVGRTWGGPSGQLDVLN